MKLMVVSPSSSAIRMNSAPRVKTGSNFGAAEVLDMGSQYHRCAKVAPHKPCFSTQRRRDRRDKRRERQAETQRILPIAPRVFLVFSAPISAISAPLR